MPTLTLPNFYFNLEPHLNLDLKPHPNLDPNPNFNMNPLAHTAELAVRAS